MVLEPKERSTGASASDESAPVWSPYGTSRLRRGPWCLTKKAEIRQITPEVGEVRLKPYVEVEKQDATMIVQTIRNMNASCILVDHRAPHSVNFQAQLAFFHQRTMRAIALWVDMRAACVAAASHMASMIRPTCSARLFYTREQAASWLHEQCPV